jgi:hypothetical protein
MIDIFFWRDNKGEEVDFITEWNGAPAAIDAIGRYKFIRLDVFITPYRSDRHQPGAHDGQTLAAFNLVQHVFRLALAVHRPHTYSP